VATFVQQLERHELPGGYDDELVTGGLTVVGGNGFAVTVGSTCSATCLPDSLLVVVERGDGDTVKIPFSEMTGLELSGPGRVITGRRFFGGGFGFEGALEGMAIASALSAATRKASVNSLLRIGSIRGEFLFHHGELTPEALRRRFSPAFTGHEAAERRRSVPQADDPVGQLERLDALRKSGAITEQEFQAARQPYVQRLTDGG
jgi:hypothetical protein